MLWDSSFSFSTGQTTGNTPAESDKPGKDATDEELLGYKEGVNFDSTEKMNYKENGGMTGYRYLSPWSVRSLANKYVLRDGGLQNNEWGIVNAIALQKVGAKSLNSVSGEGKSQVTSLYKNGVEIKIEYKYPTSQEIFHFKERSLGQSGQFYYARNISYEESHYGVRGVYTLGNNYFVIDQLPESGLPASISLATSWNMPSNTTQLGTSGWQRFVFEGVTPDSTNLIDPTNTRSGTYRSESRIEIAIAGATNVTAVIDSASTLFEVTHNNRILTTHLTFENSLSTHNFMAAQFRVADITETLPAIVMQVENYTTVTGGIVWQRTYSDNSKDLLVYNPNRHSQVVQGITSDAKVWLLHANTTGNWIVGRLFGARGNPLFAGFSSTPSVIQHNGTPSTEIQYEITF